MHTSNTWAEWQTYQQQELTANVVRYTLKKPIQLLKSSFWRLPHGYIGHYSTGPRTVDTSVT